MIKVEWKYAVINLTDLLYTIRNISCVYNPYSEETKICKCHVATSDATAWNTPTLPQHRHTINDRQFLSHWDSSTNLKEDENIQNLLVPAFGPSPKNSCPSPCLHLPQRTFKAVLVSGYLWRHSGEMGLVKAGQGDPCSYFAVERNKGLSHSLQT